jgi:hypothetical protein
MSTAQEKEARKFRAWWCDEGYKVVEYISQYDVERDKAWRAWMAVAKEQG